jgi:hypothetical protein
VAKSDKDKPGAILEPHARPLAPWGLSARSVGVRAKRSNDPEPPREPSPRQLEGAFMSQYR